MAAKFNRGQQEALRAISDDSLLLETDAPYFAPPDYNVSTPNLIGYVAEVVARIQGQSWQHVLRVSTRAAQELYGKN
jgi:Tat protein secretion system quality control protein TatD with DNase activity